MARDGRSLLPARAVVVGGDGFFFFDDRRDWVVTGKFSGSRVSGAPTAIEEIQRSEQHYFQRPDAAHVSVDPHRTSLTGFAGRINLNRNSGKWRVNAALSGVSPGFESNDIGFHRGGDRAGGHAVLLWRKQDPDRWTRERGFWIAKAWAWNFDRVLLGNIWFGCSHALFLNYWRVNGCVFYGYRGLDDTLTRGGPLAVDPRGNGLNVGFNTDVRKRISLEGNGGRDSNEFGAWGSNNRATVTVKVLPSLTVSAGPQIIRVRNIAQYVDTVDDRAVFGTMDQTEVSMQTRVNWIVSPRASLHVFAQPLLSAGGYDDFKELAAPRTYLFRPFAGEPGSLSFDSVEKRYSADPDASGPAPGFSFDDPDFNSKSLRLNAVFRWEFRPGSTFYAVWTEFREDDSYPGDFRFRRDVRRLFSAPSDDVFLLKLTYWLGR